MGRKRLFQAAVLTLVLFAGAIALRTWGPKQKIKTIYLSPDEQRLTDVLETTVALRFEVGKRAYVSRLPYTLRTTYWDSKKFEYGEPVLIACGIRGIDETFRTSHDWDAFAEGSVEPWLQNDNVWAFKVQIDLPGE